MLLKEVVAKEGVAVVIGISAHYHDAAACLIRNGEIVSGVQEERLTRIKFDPNFPINSIHSCLDNAGLRFTDIDAISFYEKPSQKLDRILWSNACGLGAPRDVTRTLRQKIDPFFNIEPFLPADIQKLFFAHHQSHAASTFFASGYKSAAVLTVDGVGEWATTTLTHANGQILKQLEAIDFPHSLGLFYAAITSFLGFLPNSDEYKVMGLASFGRARFKKELSSVLLIAKDGTFQLDPLFFDYNHKMYSPALSALLQCSPRMQNDEVTSKHADIAASAQLLVEESLLCLTKRLHKISGETNLCLAGGVALNCVANARLRKESPFTKVFVQPASGDAGGALGAAYLASISLGDIVQPMHSALIGPSFKSNEIASYLNQIGVEFIQLTPDRLAKKCASLIANGAIIGWFQGRMEFGPRALGARSILADPRDAMTRERLNLRIKRREPFRPFAPVCLRPFANTLFEADYAEPFMTFVVKVRESCALGAVTHTDGTARLQTIEDDESPLARLLHAFAAETGIPCLLNTSFNLAGEPIVCTPYDAFNCFREGLLDALVLENLLVERSRQDEALVAPGTRQFIEFARELKPYVRDTYTFT